METFRRITISSRWLSHLCLALILLLPLYLAHHWLLPTRLWLDGMPFGPASIYFERWPPPADKQILGIVISYLPGLLVAKGLWHLRRLFTLYSQGQFFSSEHVSLYRRTASATLWFVVVWVISQSLMSVAMTYGTDRAVLSLTFTHAHAIALFAAILLRVITWIMSAAQELAAENQQFV